MAGIEVDQMHEQPRSLGVTQESVPQPLALGRARNETRQIGDDERAVLVHPDDPESGLERRERKSAILGLAAESRETSVDLPAFGKPSTPTSASSLSSM